MTRFDQLQFLKNLPYTKKIASSVLATPLAKKDTEVSKWQTTQSAKDSKLQTTQSVGLAVRRDKEAGFIRMGVDGLTDSGPSVRVEFGAGPAYETAASALGSETDGAGFELDVPDTANTDAIVAAVGGVTADATDDCSGMLGKVARCEMEPETEQVVLQEESHLQEVHGRISGNDATTKALNTFAASLKKPIPGAVLTTPVTKRTPASEEIVESVEVQTKRKSTRIANRPKTGLTMEEQATQLLMKKCGLLEADAVPVEKAKEVFCEKFVDHMESGFVTGLRDMFGISGDDGSNPLQALAVEAEA